MGRLKWAIKTKNVTINWYLARKREIWPTSPLGISAPVCRAREDHEWPCRRGKDHREPMKSIYCKQLLCKDNPGHRWNPLYSTKRCTEQMNAVLPKEVFRDAAQVAGDMFVQNDGRRDGAGRDGRGKGGEGGKTGSRGEILLLRSHFFYPINFPPSVLWGYKMLLYHRDWMDVKVEWLSSIKHSCTPNNYNRICSHNKKKPELSLSLQVTSTPAIRF